MGGHGSGRKPDPTKRALETHAPIAKVHGETMIIPNLGAAGRNPTVKADLDKRYVNVDGDTMTDDLKLDTALILKNGATDSVKFSSDQDGRLLIEGLTGNLENLFFDFDVVNNTVDIGTTSGVSNIKWLTSFDLSGHIGHAGEGASKIINFVTADILDFVGDGESWMQMDTTATQHVLNFNVDSNDWDYIWKWSTGTALSILGSTGVTTIGSGLELTITAKTANYIATLQDHVITCGAGNESFTVTLPALSGNTGLVYHIKNVGTGTITVDGGKSEKIDGATTAVLNNQYESITIQAGASEWHII